jgi:hypothetical protein
MSTYSEISDNYKMFETKAPVEYHDDVKNYFTVEDMMNYMFNVLNEYDRCMSKKQDAQVNPMGERVHMRTETGIIFEIPQSIQKSAIATHLYLKNKKNEKMMPKTTKNKIIEKFEVNFDNIIDNFGNYEHFDQNAQQDDEQDDEQDDAQDDEQDDAEDDTQDDTQEQDQNNLVHIDATKKVAHENNTDDSIEEFCDSPRKLRKMVSSSGVNKNMLKKLLIILLVLVVFYSLYQNCKEGNRNF